MRLSLLWLLLLGVIVLQGCGGRQPAERPFDAKDGTLDLTSWDQTGHALIPLNGEWNFYWKQLLSPEDFDANVNDARTGTIRMPSNWETYTLNGRALPREGYATFRLRVVTSLSGEVFGFQVPIMYSSYKLWVDDRLIARNGRVGTDTQASVPQKYPKVVYFTPQDRAFTVTLQISNYDDYSGGMWEPIKLGLSEDVHAGYLRRVLPQTIMLGILVLSGIYHVGLGLFRRTDSYFLYFGMFCLVAAFRYLMVGDVFMTKLFPSINWELAMRLEYISLYLHVPLWGMVIHRLYPKDSSKQVIRAAIWLTAVYTVMTIVLEAKVYYRFLIYFQGMMVLYALYSLVIIVRGLRRKQEGAVYALIGIAFMTSCIVVDIFGFMLKYADLNLYPFGIGLFIICFSLVISKRLSTALSLSEQLTADLSQLNRDLEQKVALRTREIQQSHNQLMALNQRLERMVLVDGLTQIANRRHFDDYYEEQSASYRMRQEPIALFYIDIDYFKLFNDRYGHQRGDDCLKAVAQTLREQASARPGGLAARYGGEEFVCVLPGCERDDAIRFAGALNRHIEALRIPHEDSRAAGHVTISIGLTHLIPSEALDRHEAIKQADQALYQAKTTGRNRFVLYGN